MAVVALVDALPFAGDLPAEFSCASFANACRRTYQQLLTGATRGWGKPELATWLEGPYARLAVTYDTPSLSVPPPSSRPIDSTRVTDLLDMTRADLLLVLRELTTPEGLSAFRTQAIETELVARSQDVDGGVGFVPRARSRMSLVDRALSLVAADVLVRPMDYTQALFVCTRCESPMFDRTMRSEGVCAVHRSGVGIRD